MKTQNIFIAFAVGLLSVHCSSSSDSSPPVVFPGIEGTEEDISTSDTALDGTSDQGQTDAASSDGTNSIDATAESDAQLSDTALKEDTVLSDSSTEAGDSDVEENEGGEGDAAENPQDAMDVAEVDVDDDVSLPEDSTTPDVIAEDTEDEEVEEPGECETDADCLFLTAQVCCPSATPSPCLTPPEVGTLEDEVAAVAWIQSNCAEVQSCPEPVAPACGSCLNLFDYAPVCDKTLGECVLESEVNCESVCEAITVVSECPFISDPDSLDETLVTECGCL